MFVHVYCFSENIANLKHNFNEVTLIFYEYKAKKNELKTVTSECI